MAGERSLWGQIGWWQLAAIIVCNKLSILTTYAPIVTGHLPVSRDAWLAGLVGPLPALFLALAICALYARRPGTSGLYQWLAASWPRWVAVPVQFGVGLLFLHWAAVTLRLFSHVFTAAFYEQTPEMVFSVVFAAVALAAVIQGLVVIARLAELGAALTVLGVAVLVLGLLPRADWGQMRPWLAGGWDPVFLHALTPMGVFGEASWAMVLAVPYLRHPKEGVKAALVALGLASVVVTLGALILLTTLGPEVVTLASLPALLATRMVRVSIVLERLDWLLILLWMSSMGVKVAVLLFGAAWGFYSALPVLRFRYWACLAAVGCVVGARFLLPRDLDVARFFLPSHFLPQALPLEVLPVLLLILGLLAHRRAARSA